MLIIVLLKVVILSVVMLSVVMLSVVMLSVVMLSVVMLSVVMLSVDMLSVILLSVVLPDCHSAGRRIALSAVENKGFRFICRRTAHFRQLDVLSNDKMKNKLTTLGRNRSRRVK
jgi:hypothetical protein